MKNSNIPDEVIGFGYVSYLDNPDGHWIICSMISEELIIGYKDLILARIPKYIEGDIIRGIDYWDEVFRDDK